MKEWIEGLMNISFDNAGLPCPRVTDDQYFKQVLVLVSQCLHAS